MDRIQEEGANRVEINDKRNGCLISDTCPLTPVSCLLSPSLQVFNVNKRDAESFAKTTVGSVIITDKNTILGRKTIRFLK